ncbi:MAG: hypothetical protein RLY57_659 [Candidatus Parcubacteria bacterium]
MPTRPLQQKINKDDIKAYKQAVQYVNSFANTSFRHNHGALKKDPNYFLLRTKQFLELCGSPEKAFKYIHITGTAGKGSVSTLTHNMLVSSGKCTGLFMSPFVTTAIEMIKVNDQYISPEAFVNIVNQLRPIITKAQHTELGGPSAFEIFFAIAILYFKQMKCEWVVLEVGLGGRYDSTNIIEAPHATAVTTIDYDHTEILGKTLEKIAYDKAGIIKQGSEFFTTETRPSLQQLFRKICKQQGAVCHVLPKKRSYKARNILLATSLARVAGVDEASIEQGITITRMPCRFECIQDHPVVILDGAHNRAKMRTTVKNLAEIKYKKLTVIFAMASTKKDTSSVMSQIIPLADKVIIAGTEEADRKSIHPNVLLPLITKEKKRSAKIEIIEHPLHAIEKAIRDAGPDDCILVTGSFFLAGEIRKRWFPEAYVLQNRKSF